MRHDGGNVVPLRLVLRFENGGDLIIGYHFRKTIGAEQHDVIGIKVQAVQLSQNTSHLWVFCPDATDATAYRMAHDFRASACVRSRWILDE